MPAPRSSTEAGSPGGPLWRAAPPPPFPPTAAGQCAGWASRHLCGLPGLLAGAALSWARALGEFGATLLFAGSLSEVTQTMPLAIYAALEMDVRLALSLSLVLAGCAVLALLLLRGLPRLLLARR